MSDPVRLCDAGDSFEMSVLAAAKDDVPGAHVGKGVRAALGLGAAAGIGATTTTAAAAGVTKGVSTITALVVVKWVGVCVMAGVALGATSAYVTQPSKMPASSSVTNSAVRSGSTRSATPTLPQTSSVIPSLAPTATSTLAPTATLTLAPPTPASALAPTPSHSGASLLPEMSSIDAARAALDAGDTTRALEQLNRYDLEYPSGQLAPESLALRVKVYAAKHDDARVLELSERFLSRYPEHPQAATMRSISQALARRAGHPSNL